MTDQRTLGRRSLTGQDLGIAGEKERVEMRMAIIKGKLERVLLPAMRAHDIDMWLIVGREFNPDPMLPDIGDGWPGVRNAYIFFDNGSDRAEKIFIGSHELREGIIPEVYDRVITYGYSQEGLRPHLREIVHARDPQRIGVNMSPTLPMADGLTAMIKAYVEEAIGEVYAGRMVSAELVARDFRANRIDEEHPIFRRLCEWTALWEETAFSSEVIHPGQTTAADVHWWMRDKARQLGVGLEFLPGVRIIRQGERLPTNSSHIIQRGDVLSVDAGLAYLDYRSDIKRTVYILREGEVEPPASIQAAFDSALQVTDVLTENMRPGAIAHQVWEETMAWAEGQGYTVAYPSAGGRSGHEPSRPEVGIYGHSIGNATHDIGARVAVDWPHAYGDRVRYPLALNQWYSVELHVTTPLPEWDNRGLPIMIEDSIVLREDGPEYLASPQRALLLV
jgi:Xaa-Pro aminopeptidase